MLSLYYDGELPSPWKEKLETHLRECAPCRSRLEQFRQLSGTLEGGPSVDEPSVCRERVWQRLNSPADTIPLQRNRIWNRSVSVPLPLLAAAAALILAFGVFFVRSGQTVTPADSALAVLDMQTIVPVSDLNGVLQYLGNDDSPDIVIIRLPESRSFMSSGEPAMIRAAEYGGGKGSR
jgi:anti-sigma factor RsiW